MSEDVVVGVDFGSSRIKAAAYASGGTLVASSSVDTPLTSQAGGDDFPVLAMLTAAAEAVAALGRPAGTIAGIAMTSMGEVGTVLSHGKLADLAFPSWYDARGAELITELERTWDPRELRDRTGRHLRTASTVAKLGHVARSGGDVPAGTFLGVCGALAWQLTGQAWQEAGLATTSGVRDVHERTDLVDVWRAAGLGHVELPPIHEPGAWSPATGGLAEALGIAEGAPVMISGHDHPVAAVGAGAVPGDVVDSMGTGEAVIAVMRPDLAADPRHIARVLDADPQTSVEVWPPTAEPIVVWERMRPGLAMRAFLDRASLTRAGLDEAAPPPARPRLVDEATLRLLESGADPGIVYDSATWAALIDRYAVLAQHGEELIRSATGARGATLLTGGGLRSPRWRAAKAALARTPLEVSTVAETATRGCAAMVGTACGWWPEPDAMPGAARVRVRPGSTGDMESAVAALNG